MRQIKEHIGKQPLAVPSLRGRSPSGRSYGRVSIELRISRENLHASVREGEDWLTIKDILDLLGFDVKLVNVVISRDKDSLLSHTHHSGSRATVVEIKKIQRDLASRSSLRRQETNAPTSRRIR